MTPHLKEFIRELDNESYIDASRDEVVIKLIEKLVEAEKSFIIQTISDTNPMLTKRQVEEYYNTIIE